MATPVMVNSRAPLVVSADRMSTLNDRLNQLSAQISSGEKFTAPSEDPAGANRAGQLLRLDERLKADLRSIERTESRLSLSEGAVLNAGEAMLRAKELTLLASTATIGDEDRKVIGREVAVLIDQLFDAGNARDESGRYLFSGEQNASPAFIRDAQGNILWNGSGASAGAEAAGIDNTAPPRGLNLFGPDASSAFKALNDLAFALQESDIELRGPALDTVLGDLEAGYNRLIDGQARIGAGRARLEDENMRLESARVQTAEALKAVKGLDITMAVAELEALKLTLSASQAIFGRIHDGTLFDRLG